MLQLPGSMKSQSVYTINIAQALGSVSLLLAGIAAHLLCELTPRQVLTSVLHTKAQSVHAAQVSEGIYSYVQKGTSLDWRSSQSCGHGLQAPSSHQTK